MHQSGDDPKERYNYNGDEPMFNGDKINATSKLNSTSQSEVSTEREYSLGGIFSRKL
jgi:hypothetical protein